MKNTQVLSASTLYSTTHSTSAAHDDLTNTHQRITFVWTDKRGSTYHMDKFTSHSRCPERIVLAAKCVTRDTKFLFRGVQQQRHEVFI